MAVRTLDFLPEIFRTPANQKFLNATLEQATKDVDLVRVNGYVGRKFTPTYRVSDNYITETDLDRTNYQLEPTAVAKVDGKVEFLSSYLDLINSLQYHGANTDNHDRLFGSEFYNFDGHIDYDKFVNFSQYYWLPAGPDTVRIESSTVSTQQNFDITKNAGGYYTVSGLGDIQNPVIYLARGGSYTFDVAQNSGFWIQTEPGVSGTRASQPNISTREVVGVTNNGASQGTVVFNVPLNTAQNFFTTMPRLSNVDLVTNIPFTDINNQLLEPFIGQYGGIDGQKNLDGKLVIFTNLIGWDIGGFYDGNEYESLPYDVGYDLTDAEKFGIWQIKVLGSGPDRIITLESVGEIPVNTKVLVREGVEYSSREFYKTTGGTLQIVPLITVIQDTLYYQDGSGSDYVGEIRLVESLVLYDIDVENDILGKKQYLAPNGVKFTNGLKVRFDSNVTPAKYQNTEYYVEGVGTGITLTRVDDLVTPEPYAKTLSNPFDVLPFDQGGYEASTDRPTVPEYITIKRSSRDLNAWSRGNRWFHIDVIKDTASYNNFDFDLDQFIRAQRPIIEFSADLRLFNSGTTPKRVVDLIDTSTTDVFDEIEGQPSYVIDGVTLVKGMRILVTAEEAGAINNRIYDVDYIDPDNNGSLQVHLSLASDGDPEENDNVVVRYGTVNQGKHYWFNGTEWVLGQQKIKSNQAPKFDVFDNDGVSFSDDSIYSGTTFAGTEIFSYKLSTGKKDPILDFALSYRNSSSIGDILFENDFVVDRFNTTAATSLRVDSGFLHIITGRSSYDLANCWQKIGYNSQQYQLISYDYNNSQRYLYQGNAAPSQQVKTLKVFAGSQLLDQDQYSLITLNNQTYIEISDTVDLRDKRITIQVYDTAKVDNSYYQIPVNLDNNALNQPFETATLGQLRNHYIRLYNESLNTVGTFPGANNSRDVDLRSNQGNIVQHSSGIPYAMLFMTDDLCNFMSSIEYARREYMSFKNKFLELCYRQPGVESLTADQAVDSVLAVINDVKTDRWAWYHSDMVPTGDTFVEQRYIISPGDSRTYVIGSGIKMSEPSPTSVLIFLDGVQLIKDLDYVVDDSSSTVRILDSTVMSVGDILVIREYNSTDGSWVPETPTKLGLYPKYLPMVVTDDTYLEPVEFIRGHDGSLTPKFGDFRDAILLELEKRIYNNIKVDYEYDRISYHDVVPGQFRTTEYSRDEINEILGREFSRWVGNNRIDYKDHDFFDSNNAFTWNYKRFKSAIDDQQLLGHWRAIYNYLYDTEHPNTRPWEMLGFAQEPDWWQDRYGPAPYTSGNLVLWDDLSQGRIYQGDRAGIDPRYARPGLTNWIPVDEYGQLKSPSQYLVKGFNGRFTKGEFAVGDQSPAETAWRNSSDFPYAVQKLLALTKPARYFGLNFDTSRYKKVRVLDQYLMTTTNRRPSNLDVNINGLENDQGVEIRSSGYINWISEYIRSLNIDPATTLKTKIESLGIQLSYKMAGFSDKKYLKAFAEQNSPQSTTDSVLIPDDDYDLVLKKSVPLKRLVYSAVIVQRTVNGYRVEGYDYDDPFFNIVPSQVTEAGTRISVLGATATIYPDSLPIVQSVPYGTEYATEQQVFDFLISYGRYLESQGFVFETRSSSLNETKNWVMAGKEFLTWAQHRWSAGNIIMLSPVANFIDIVLKNSIVDRIMREYHGAKILDQNFNAIKERDITINRIDNSFNLTVIDQSTVALAVFNTVQFEHVFVPNNVTVFNDVIYQPEIGSRQSRIRLVGFKTGGWTGNIISPGFVLNQDNVPEWRPNNDYLRGSIVQYKGNYYTAIDKVPATPTFDYQIWSQIDYDKIKKGLLPNFTNRSANIETYYDTDNVNLESDADSFSKGLIGYRTRDYFDDLGLDDTSQIRFYQGYIKQKGTRNAITALTRAQLDNLNSDIDYYEEWAFRTGEYGATDINQMIEIRLDDAKITNDVAHLKLLSATESVPKDIASFAPADIYRRPKGYNGKPFITRDTDSDLNREIERAGYARLDDIDLTVFDILDTTKVTLDLDRVGVGKKIWVAKDFNGSWNVYRVSETNVIVVTVTNAGNGLMRVKTSDLNNISSLDLVIIKGYLEYDGIYRVKTVLSANEFVVQSTEEKMSTLVDNTGNPSSVDGTGALYRLQSVRYQVPADAVGTEFGNYWVSGEKIWVDQSDSDGRWAVYEKSEPWSSLDKVTPPGGVASGNFGRSAYITADADMVLVGAPGQGSSGEVKVYVRDTETWATTLSSSTAGMSGFGTVLVGAALDGDVNEEYIAVGSPAAGGGSGIVEVIKKVGTTFTAKQTLDPTGNEFGYSLAMSRDARWLYVGSPGNNSVYAYAWDVAAEEYVLHTTLTYAGSNPGDRFGHSVFTTSDGSQVIVGSPFLDTGSTTDNGAVFVFDRSVEALIANGTDTVYTTKENIDDIGSDTKVTVDKVILTEGADYTLTDTNEITFDSAPQSGSVIRIDTNQFRLQQNVLASTLGVGSNFGYSLVMCNNDCTLFVGNPNWDSGSLNTGSVSKVTNQARVYGSITGSVTNPTVTIGDGIRINDFVVEFTGTSLDDVVDDINDADLPGVTAAKSSNRLVITSDSQVRLDRLRISPLAGSALTDLGLSTFVEEQVITPPVPRSDENFGMVLALSDDSRTLFVGSPNASMRRFASFDSTATTFDVGSTVFSELERQSGAVYVFEFLSDPRATPATPGKFDFVQELIVSQDIDGMEPFDKFGSSLALKGDYLVVGAIGDGEINTAAGAIYDFTSSGQSAWRVLRQQEPQIQTDAINRVFLYSIKQNQIVSYLDIFDPAKGRILGAIDRDLDYITSQDPASYNNLSREPSYWSEQYVGKYWWDTDSVRYIDYEQGDYNYRTNHWGSVFPGSQIMIYEWVKSSVPPSQFNAIGGVGTPRYLDDSRYVTTTQVDEENGVISTVYYYWVGNRTVSETSRHSYTTQQLAQILQDPRAQGVEYAAIMAPDVIGLYNINRYVSGTDTVLAVDYDVMLNRQEIHAEYQLVQEDNAASVLPTRIVNKLVDSLSGQDAYGNAVPQPNLPVSMRYGLMVRPRQTIFQNRTLALKNLVDYVNRILAANKITDSSSLLQMSEKSPTPSAAEAGYSETVDTYRQLGFIDITTVANGYRVLVLSDESNELGGWAVYQKTSGAWSRVLFQTYDTTRYWILKDWYAPGYSAASKVKYTIASREQLVGLDLIPGDLVKIRNRGNGNFEILRIENDLTTAVVGIEKGTIELLPSIYTGTNNASEIRSILHALRDDIFIGDLAVEFNRIFFLLIRYALVEQKNIDWVFKTSFIGVKHRLRSLETFPTYQVDNQDYLEKYLEEVKPYRTKIREYLLDYNKLDPYDGYLTDFDLPAYYDTVYRRYRSPSGEIPTDIDLWQNDQKYQNWYQNHQYIVESIQIQSGGTGYSSAPVVLIAGGGGSGATAYSRIANGRVVAIVVTDPGSGYTTTPTVTLAGGNGTGARAYAQLANGMVRNISTSVRLDRVRYESSVMFWQPNTQLYRGDLVRHENVVYRVVTPFITGSTFSSNNLEVLLESTIADWEPTAGYVSGDLVVYENKIYRATASFASNATFDMTPLLEHLPTGVASGVWTPFTSYAAGTIISKGSALYRASKSFISGKAFSIEGFELLLDDANDRAMRYYQTESGLLGVELSQLVGTLNYEGTVVNNMEDAVPIDETYLNSLIDCYVDDTDLGLRPQDINANIGQFITTVTRKAPKELVPGSTFDSYDIQVYSLDSSELDEDSAGLEIEFKTYNGNGVTTKFIYSDLAYNDGLLVYSDQLGSRYKDVDYVQDFFSKTITFNVAPSASDKIYIYAFGGAGNNEVSRDIRIGDGTTVDFDFMVAYSSVTDSLVAVDGTTVTNYTLINNNGITRVRFNTAPENGKHIFVRLFASPPGIQTYNQLHRQIITLTGNPSDYTVNLTTPLRYDGPWSASVVVEVDEIRLRPANNGYYQGNGSNTTFNLSDTIDIDAATVPDNSIEVYLNGVRKRQFVEYNIVNDLTNIDIVFINAPASGDEVVISCLVGAQFRMNSESQILIDPSVTLRPNGKMRIYSFSNHDNVKMRTQVFIGLSDVTTITYTGFDQANFDIGGFEDTTSFNQILPRYTLSRPVSDVAYLWVTLNGRRLYPGIDFNMVTTTDLQMSVNRIVTETDVVVITHFEDAVRTRAIGFRLRQNTQGEIEYLRISDENSTLLLQDLDLNDTEIFVKNASRLGIPTASVPGVVMINKERITYGTIDLVNNKLGQIRRGTGGTGALAVHKAGSKVVDVGAGQMIPSDHVMETVSDEQVGQKLQIQPGTDSIWYDVLSPSDPLQTSSTAQAEFLLQKHAYFSS